MEVAKTWMWQLESSPSTMLTSFPGALIAVIFPIPIVFFLVLRILRRFVLAAALKKGYTGKDKLSLLVLKYVGGKQPATLEFQESLPQLPLPTLKNSLRGWLDSVKHLVSEEEFCAAKQAAEELENSEEGRELQGVLEQRKREKDNWLTDWWVDFAYLRGRVPLPTLVSFYSVDTYDNMYGACYTDDQIQRCADLIDGQLDFKQLLDEQKFRPQRIGGVVPVCMEGFYMIYGITRIPGEEIDELRVHKVPKGGDAHVLLMIGHAIHKLPVWVGGKRVPKETLYAAIKDAAQKVKKEGWFSQSNVSMLTSRNRTEWAKNRQAIIGASPVNASNMKVIEESLFAMVLSENATECPKSNRSLAWEAFCGDGSRIWYDKGFSIIVYKDGRAAWHYEHTYADAPVPAMACEYSLIVSNPRSKQYKEYKDPVYVAYEGGVSAELLEWDATNVPELPKMITAAKQEFDHLVHDLALSSLYVYKFGINDIKKFKVSPDAFCQAALQVAAYQYFGRHVLTYESASLRLFKRGRTETIRSATDKMTEFARALVEGEHKKVDGKDKLVKMLCDASNKHSSISKEASQGRGFDRHLLAIKLAAITTGRELPALFKTKAYNLEYELSTSQSPIVQEHNRAPTDMMTQGGGFGPTANPGIGCSYHPQRDRLYFNISARSTDAAKDQAKFQNLLEAAIQEMRGLFTEQLSAN